MTDREFAQLQMARNSAASGRERANLTKRVNNELARRKTSPDSTPKRADAKPVGPKTAKSKDPTNWRKGKDIKVGDKVSTNAYSHTGELTTVTEYLGTTPYMGTTNHKWKLANGGTMVAGGGEFVAGSYGDKGGSEAVSNIDAEGWNGAAIGSELTYAERSAAQRTFRTLAPAARRHQGIPGPAEGDAIPVHFPNRQRAYGFAGEMHSKYLTVKTDDRVVWVRKPDR